MAKPPPFGRKRTGPLVVFIHVPKAAGSTVNHHLNAWSPHGFDHAENLARTPDKIARMLPKLDWISGHLALNTMLDILRHTDRDIRLFGTMRQPLSHVAAQYNWQVEIFHRGAQFYNAHPQGIRALSAQIRASDNTNPQAIIDILRAHHGLFLNLQSRFLLGDDIALDLKASPASTRLALYEKIALPWELNAMLTQITGAPPEPRTENTSIHHFDRAVFNTEPLTDFVLRNNRFDYKLFWHLKG